MRACVRSAGALVLALVVAGTLGLKAQADEWFLEQVAKWLSDLPSNVFDPAIAANDAATQLAEIEGDYDPSHYPLLHVTCFHVPKCRACLAPAEAIMDDDFFKGENNWVLYQRTKKKYDMMVALADGAANLGQYAKYAWALQKGSPRSEMNVAKKAFEDHYNEAQKQHLVNIKKALEMVATCERDYAGDNDWYGRNGAPFLLQLTLRYTDK